MKATKSIALVETTVIGYAAEVRNVVARAQLDGRQVEYRNGPELLPTGEIALTIAIQPLTPALTGRTRPQQVWEWVTDGHGVIWLGIGAYTITAGSVLTLMILTTLEAIGMVTAFFQTYCAFIIGLGVALLITALVLGTKGKAIHHCPGPWHR